MARQRNARREQATQPPPNKQDRMALAAIFLAAGMAEKARSAKAGEMDKLQVMAVLTNHRLATSVDSAASLVKVRSECADAFEAAISKGYEVPCDARAQCEHQRFAWEDCIACYDIALLSAVEHIRKDTVETLHG